MHAVAGGEIDVAVGSIAPAHFGRQVHLLRLQEFAARLVDVDPQEPIAARRIVRTPFGDVEPLAGNRQAAEVDAADAEAFGQLERRRVEHMDGAVRAGDIHQTVIETEGDLVGLAAAGGRRLARCRRVVDFLAQVAVPDDTDGCLGGDHAEAGLRGERHACRFSVGHPTRRSGVVRV